LLSYAHREALELRRDPIRGSMALLGSLLLLFIIGYGISMDVEDLTFAVLDHDQSTTSQAYRLNLSGSRYFSERLTRRDRAVRARRGRRGADGLEEANPPSCGGDHQRGAAPANAAWVGGAGPTRADPSKGYVQGIHTHCVQELAPAAGQPVAHP